jgi:hypothetical protein
LVSAGKRAHDLYALAWDVGETNKEECISVGDNESRMKKKKK